MKHFIAMAGIHGCMPNYCGACESYQDAVESLSSLHELGKNRKASLKRDGILELNMAKDGNEYCEIVDCDCADPECHEQNG